MHENRKKINGYMYSRSIYYQSQKCIGNESMQWRSRLKLLKDILVISERSRGILPDMVRQCSRKSP